MLGNRQHPFGLVHGVLASGILTLLEVHQSVAKPEQLAAVGWASCAFEDVQKPIETVSDGVRLRGRWDSGS